MTASELINKYFVKENGYQPKNVDISDHFALGCKLIIEGHVDAGLKIVSGSLSMAKCTGKKETGQIRNYVKKNSVEAGLMVRPHYEVVKELEVLQAAIKKAQEKK